MKPLHVQERKIARTRLYRALYGAGSNTINVPWQDPTRNLPENWNASDAFATIRYNWRAAKFSDLAKRQILSDIRTRINGVLTTKDLEG